MCGIVGIISSHSLHSDYTPVIRDMMDSIKHRGPDDQGLAEDSQALLGHLRLAIIDIEHGQQPMYSDDGRYVLIYNGEIYNYLELRQSLIQKGVHFKTFSDTEVLLKLLEHKGKDAVHQLNGMFSFVFFDTETKEWIAARDHFGIKPFYYTIRQEQFIFGSEIKAILQHPNVESNRDDLALQQYLTFQLCMNGRTMFDGIHKLEPGMLLTGNGHEIKSKEQYWDTSYQIDYHHTEEYFTDQLRSLLEDSVRLQLRSDVPLGSYLSGGIDSSLVSVLSSNHLAQPIPMYHGRFDEGAAYDESYYAKIIVDQVKGEYKEIVPTPEDFVQYMPDLISALDEPVAGPGLFPHYCVSKLASNDVKVILGGQGGDELFGGYARYLVGYLEQALKGAIFETQEEGRHLVTLESIIPQLPILKQYRPLLSQFWSKGLFEEMDARYFHLIDRSPDQKNLITKDLWNQFDHDVLFEEFRKVFNHADTSSYINKMTHFDQKTLLPALLQIEDRVSMAVSIESRVPLLDRRIVDLVTSMPPPLKFQGGRTKHILKKSIRTLLPDSVLNRKDKMGFPVPLKEWMADGPVRDFVGDVLLSKKSRQRGLYRSEALEFMMSNQGVGSRQLWGALCLELWHQRFIDA